MSRKLYLSIYMAIAVALMSCGKKSSASGESDDVTSDTIEVARYAKGFHLTEDSDGIRYLTIADPQHENKEVYKYALIPRGTTVDKSAIPEEYLRLNIPIDRVICMTSLQLSNFISLGVIDKIVGITSTRHLFNEDINRRLKEGKTSKIGIEGSFDAENIMALEPQLILISPFKRGGYDGLLECGIPLMPHLGYKETHPLGQAEWIKLIGILTGHEDEANACFNSISHRYDSLSSLVDEVSIRPVVMSGEFRGGHWYAPGGKSFLANLIEDAGGRYFLSDNEQSGGVTLDFETVYAQAEKADYWRIVNSFEGDFDYKALLDEEPRYGDFKSFRNHGVIYCNMRTRPFYELMPMEPDKVLADLISVLHPDSIEGHTTKFYALLK